MVVETLMNIGASFKVHHVALFLKKFPNEFLVFGLRVLEYFLSAGDFGLRCWAVGFHNRHLYLIRVCNRLENRLK